MGFCSNCGKPLPEGAKFCESCGAPVLYAKGNQQGSLDDARESNVIQMQGSLNNMQEAVPQVQQMDPGYAPETPSKGTVPEGSLPKKKKKPIGAILLGLIAAAAAVFFLRPSGWSTEDAQNFTQAYLECCFFRGDDETLAKYMEDTTAEELSELREEKRDEIIESGIFDSDVPVTKELKTRYADFYIDLMKNARFTVGEAVKTEDGFEVPVSIEPITSLAEGDFVLLDLQLNDDLSQEQLNERVYSQELELMKDLTKNLSYGEEKDFVMHISRLEDGRYDISQDDLEFVNLNAGNDDYFITVHMENYTSDEERNAEDCNVYGIDVQSVAEDLGDAAELMSIGGIRIGDTKEDAISAFGTPAAGDETDDYVAYNFDDYMYSIQFIYNEDGIIDAMYLSNLYF